MQPPHSSCYMRIPCVRETKLSMKCAEQVWFDSLYREFGDLSIQGRRTIAPEKVSEVMDLSLVCPTEDAVRALLDYLVDPMLPAKSSARYTPSLSQQQSIANQVHAVVLLYNYYHRKQHPQLEFLDFESFCKLATVLKQPLLTHMKLMQRSDSTEIDDLDKQISLTEKTIMDACDICKTLEASNVVANSERWPISKVAVFLVDSGEKNCLLQFSSITQGVWSIIEKNIDNSNGFNHNSQSAVDDCHRNKKKFFTKQSWSDPSAAEAGLLQLAFSAVKDATGINQTDLMILERRIVYSLSKEKTAAQFFLMKYTRSINEDITQVPIKDVIDSLQGPLVNKFFCSWTTTPVVEYFHLLPYAGIISQWLSRDVSSDNLQDLRMGLGNVDVNSSLMTEKPCDGEVDKNRDIPNGNSYVAVFIGKKAGSTNCESPIHKEKNGCCVSVTGLSNDFSGPRHMDEDGSYVPSPQHEEKSRNIQNLIQIDRHQKKMNASLESDQNVSTSSFKAEVLVPEKKNCNANSSAQDGIPTMDQALITHQSDSRHLHKLHTITSKENKLSQTALSVLHRKRDKLAQQQRIIEDEIARCDKNIQTILNGGEDDFALKIESIIEGCNEVCLRSVVCIPDRTYQHFEDKVSPQSQCMKRQRLSEAVLNTQNPCQELDGICYENNWLLPTYHVSSSVGGFLANATLRGVDFEHTILGDLHANPHEARESAALHMLTKLRDMVGQAN